MQLNSAEEVESFLAHHGILGMHWGQRKARSASIIRAKKIKKNTSPTSNDASAKTKHLGEAAGLAALGYIGSGLVRAYGPKSPKVQIGAQITQTVLGTSIIGLAIATKHSGNTDLIKKYGT